MMHQSCGDPVSVIHGCFPGLGGGDHGFRVGGLDPFPGTITYHTATQDELDARNAFLRTPEGKDQMRREKVALWRERFNEAKAKLKELGEEV